MLCSRVLVLLNKYAKFNNGRKLVVLFFWGILRKATILLSEISSAYRPVDIIISQVTKYILLTVLEFTCTILLK